MKKTVLEGKWLVDGKQLVGDETCRKIDLFLTTLSRIASRDGGWTSLNRDPKDGSFWELTYPQSGMHGGGPPRLESYSSDAPRNYTSYPKAT